METLKYVIVPGQWPVPGSEHLYKRIYQCWEATWNEAFRDLGKPEGYLKSDAFTRQDFVGALFNHDQCVALSFFRRADPAMPTFRADSYFSNWSDTHIRKLRSYGDDIVICSNFVITKEARGENLGVSLKDVLIGITLRAFREMQADALSGTPRTNRKMNEACAKWGGTEIARGMPSGHGDTVDLMGFFSKVLVSHPRQPLSDLVDELWEQRTDSVLMTRNPVLKIAS